MNPSSETKATALGARRRGTSPPPPRRIDGLARSPRGRAFAAVLAAALAAVVSGCALRPPGLEGERAALVDAKRAGPPGRLPAAGSGEEWRPWVERALAVHGDVRGAWFAWKAAVERVEGASAWPNTRLAVGYSRVFGGDAMGGARNMVDARPDSMANLEAPAKARAAGREALAEAQAAGEEFRKVAARVRRLALEAWLDLAWAAEESRLAAEASELSRLAAQSSAVAAAASGTVDDALASAIADARADDAAATVAVDLHHARQELAAVAAIDDAASIALPAGLPTPRVIPAEEVVLGAAARSPEVAAMRRERDARRFAEERARLQWIPDLNPAVTLAGGAEQVAGAMLMLPTTVVAIRSSVAAARAERRASVARLAQARRDVRAETAAALAEALDGDRRLSLLQRRIAPAAADAATTAERAYTAGRGPLGAVVEARLAAVEVRSEAAATAIQREKALAALEQALGVPLEDLGHDQLVTAPLEASR